MKSKAENRNTLRRRQTTPVEFLVEGDIVNATTLEVSESGLRLKTEEPLCFTLRFMVNNQAKVYRTHMVWAAKEDEGDMTYGLKFIEEPKPSDS